MVGLFGRLLVEDGWFEGGWGWCFRFGSSFFGCFRGSSTSLVEVKTEVRKIWDNVCRVWVGVFFQLAECSQCYVFSCELTCWKS